MKGGMNVSITGTNTHMWELRIPFSHGCHYQSRTKQKGVKMGISEKKMKIVIDNYFKAECNINTSIKDAFEKGFRIGVIKGQSVQPEIIRCKDCEYIDDDGVCQNSKGLAIQADDDFCSHAERWDG